MKLILNLEKNLDNFNPWKILFIFLFISNFLSLLNSELILMFSLFFIFFFFFFKIKVNFYLFAQNKNLKEKEIYLNILNKLLNFLNSEKFLELKKLSIINKLKSLLHVWNVNNIYYSWFSFKNSPNQVLIFSKLFVTFYSKFELKSLSDTQKLAFLKNSIK